MISSARSVSSRMLRSSLWMAIAMIGDSLGSKCRMIGSSMFGGSCRRMRAIFAWTSCSAVPISTPRLNIRRTVAVPSMDVEVISLIPCTVLSASSTGFATSRIIDSGDAPGYDVLTMTTGYVMSGYSSIARRLYDTTPSTMSRTIIIVAKTGRLIEISERNMAGLRLRLLTRAGLPSAFFTCDDDLHTAAERADVADDDAVPLRQSAQHLGDASALVHHAKLHVGDIEHVAREAVHERPAVLG